MKRYYFLSLAILFLSGSEVFSQGILDRIGNEIEGRIRQELRQDRRIPGGQQPGTRSTGSSQ